jgi:2,4-dienoyl-CoA reductase-like NADH-dependent reductase (Old Yellow Enzyme family)
MENSVKLFSTLKIRDCELPNRVVAARSATWAFGTIVLSQDLHAWQASSSNAAQRPAFS